MRATRRHLTPWRTAGIVLATALATVLAMLGRPLPAAADEIVQIDLEGFTGTITYNDGGTFDGVAVLPPAESSRQVSTQCTPIPGTVSGLCVGSPTDTEQPPLDVVGLEEISPLVKWDEGAQGALGWIAAEGEEFIRTAYDVPADDRIGRYARAELREYVVSRLLNIMDKRVYGVDLTEDEAKALAWVESESSSRDRLLAQTAWSELQRYDQSPCTYRPPAAPAYVANPPKLPEKVTTWCQQFKLQASELFNIAPPRPSAQSFLTWASYRNADALGLGAFNDKRVTATLAQMTVAMASATALGAGMLRAATLYGLAVSGALARQLISTVFPHASRLAYKFASEAAQLAAQSAARQASLLSSIASAIFVAIVVIVFAVVVGVASWQVFEHESVSTSLKANLDEALDNEDPFLLAPERAKHNGKPLNSELDVTKPPAYRSEKAQEKLAALVTLWTTTSRTGTVTGDPTGIWANPVRVASDPKWVVRVGDGDPVVRNEVVIRQAGATWTRVGFSRGWMVLTPEEGGAPKPKLSFGYINRDGHPELVNRAPSKVGGFNVYSASDFGWDGHNGPQSTLTWRNKDNEVVRARLQRPAPTYLQGPRPTAVGPLVAGRPVLLRPNPVGTTGQSLDPATVQGDYEFDWTVERLDPATGQWGVLPVTDGFGTSFTPSQTGEYDARVTMTSLDDATDQRFGSVRFTIGSPPILPRVLSLQDNGYDRLELDLQLGEDVATDEMTVQVTWPGEVGQDDVVQELVTPCIQTGPLDCTTPRTGLANTLVHTVTPSTDLRRPVLLQVTNSTGGVFTTEFHLDQGRPSLAAPPDGSNTGEPGAVEVGETSTQVLMPLDDTAGQQEYTVARLVPSPGGGQDFGLLDPATGNTTGLIPVPGVEGIYVQLVEDDAGWVLQVRGAPDLTDFGVYEVPVVLVQTNTTRQLAVVVVHVVPTTGDRFRGGLQTDLDPDDFAVADRPRLSPAIFGGKVSDPRYAGRMCVRIGTANPSGPRGTWCGPLSDFYRSDGTVRPFPYERLLPQGMPSETYDVSAWLTQESDRVDNTPIGTRFFLSDDDTYPAPSIWVASVTATGIPRVGRVLAATFGSVYPATATKRYQWLRDGRPISGATGATYTLRRVDRGTRISVRVALTAPDFVRTVKTSAPTRAVLPPS